MKFFVVSNALLLYVLATIMHSAISDAKDFSTSMRRRKVKKNFTARSERKLGPKGDKNPGANKRPKADKGQKTTESRKGNKKLTNKKKNSKALKCESFPTVSSFDLDRYAGRWYLIYATDSPSIIKRCGAANYNPTPPTVSIVNSGFCSPGEMCPPPYGVYFSVTGSGMPNPGIPNEVGKFLVTLNTAFGSFTFNYFVVDVVSDSDSNETAPYKFAAVTDPYFPGGALTYILSREKKIDPSDEHTVALMLDKVKRAGISLENIIPVEQDDACVYDA